MNRNRGAFEINNLGVIANPAAGAGKEYIEKVTHKALNKFAGTRIIRPKPEGREETIAAVIELASNVDAILIVGGDGTMSDAAFGLFKEDADTPIIGIGAGSTNAGPLITLKAEEIEKLFTADLNIYEIGGIQVSLNSHFTGVGYNDVMLGDTVLTTIESRVVQVSASEFMKNRKMPMVPRKVGEKGSKVYIGRPEGTVKVHDGEFGQFFAAPVDERFLGKGLAGGTSLAAALGLPAGIAITSEPLINFSITSTELMAMEPLVTKTASFREKDVVVVKGIRQGTCLNVDGNPLAILGPDDEVHLRYIPSAARVLKLSR